MKTISKVAEMTGTASLAVVLALSLLASYSSRAAYAYWGGIPNTTATTNWSDFANWPKPPGTWTTTGGGAGPTYYNQVEFNGVGTYPNTVTSVNNVLDSTSPGSAAIMPIWYLIYDPTNGNYTTLIDPGVTMTIGVGNHGYFAVGADQLNGSTPAPANAVEIITITGVGGTLNMTGSSANLWVGQGSPTAGDSHNITLDLSGLDNFFDYAGAGSGNFIHIAYGNPSANNYTPNENGTLYLARTNNISLGTDFQIGNQPGTNSLPIAVYLGMWNDILTGTGNLVVGGPGTGPAGAVLAFNPAFVGGTNTPTAYFGSNGGSGRVANFDIGFAGSTTPGYGLCDFTGGSNTVMAETMQLGQGNGAGANSQGILNFDLGTVNVNNATIGNQEVSSGGTGVGMVNIGSNATLTVNNTLTLAAVTGTLTPGTAGTINVHGGTLAAANIVNGAGAGTINVTNGTVAVAGTAGTPASPVSSLSLNNSALTLSVKITSTNLVVGSLTTGGTTNIINISSVPLFPSYPVQITLIKYSGSIGGSGFDFGLGTAPALVAGYLSNNIANGSVDLVMTSGPSVETWTGSANGNWDTSSQNWLVGGSPATYADGDAVQFFDGASISTVNLTTTLSPNSITVSNTSPGYTFNGSGRLTGTAALVKQGTGTLLVDNGGSNDFAGGVILSGGVLQVGNNDTSGNLPSGAVTDNGLLIFARTDTPTVSSTISGSGGLAQAGTGGTLLLSGANSFSGPVVVTNGSTLKLGSSSAAGTGTNNLTIASGSTLDANGQVATKPIIVSGTGVGGNGAIVNSGTQIYDSAGGLGTSIMLAGDTTFAFQTTSNRWDLGSSGGGNVLGALGPYNLTINGGGYFEWKNLSVQSPLANITVASGNLGVVGSTTFGDPGATLTIAPGAALQPYGPNVVINKNVDFMNGAFIINSSGNNVINGAMTLEAGYDEFCVASGTTLTLSNVLSGSGVFYQSADKNNGSGTTIINGNSPSFSGGVLLYTGQLMLNGLIGSGITSISGTTISGSGTANGPVDVSGTFLPGGAGLAGTFSAGGGFTLESGASLTMDLSSTAGAGGPNDLIAVTGNLTLNGNTININPYQGSLAAGTYTLFTYSGTLSGTVTASMSGPSRYTLAVDTSTPGQVNLVVSGQGDLLQWNNGANNGQWDVASSQNWSNLTTHAQDQFLTADTVAFDDSILSAAHPATTVTIPAGQVVIPTVISNDSTANYTIAGAGKISGGAGILKLGSSTLTLSTTNDFTGNIVVGGGTLLLSGITATAGATNGTLVVSNGAQVTVNLSGKYSPGDAGFGNKPLVVSGTGVNGKGAIQFTGGALYNDSATMGLGQNITLVGDTTISGTARFDWGYPGAGTTLSTRGSNYNLTVNLGGTYNQWYDIGFDTNLGNIDLYTTASSLVNIRVEALGASLGNPTNVLTLHSNIEFNIQHGDTRAGDNGYAKVVHVLPTAVWQFQPSGGAGDYRLNTSFVLETNAGLRFFSVGGGSGSGVAIAGPVTLNGLANIQIGNGPVTFSNVISGAGGFYVNQYSGYPLVFTAANTYQGITDLRSGIALSLVGNGSISDSTVISLASGATLAVTNRTDGTLTLASGQTLQGAGTVQGILVAGPSSVVSPGTNSATATLGVSGNAALNANTVMKLNGAANDVLLVGGTLTYGGTLTLTNISASPLAAGNSFTLFSAAGYSGSFTGISPATPGSGLAWDTNDLAVNGTISVVSTAASGPYITRIGLTGTTLTLQGTNGTANGQYVLLQSTNVALPLNQWLPALTNSFDSNGDFSLSTNIVNPANPHEFYILKTQ